MKEINEKVYRRRTRKLFETQLYTENLIDVINTWAVPLVRYPEPFLTRDREELKKMDQRTRKLETIYRAVHAKDDIE